LDIPLVSCWGKLCDSLRQAAWQNACKKRPARTGPAPLIYGQHTTHGCSSRGVLRCPVVGVGFKRANPLGIHLERVWGKELGDTLGKEPGAVLGAWLAYKRVSYLAIHLVKR
jgi:hypothetical protein